MKVVSGVHLSLPWPMAQANMSVCMYGMPLCPTSVLLSVGVTTAVLSEICLGRRSYESKRKDMVRKDNK